MEFSSNSQTEEQIEIRYVGCVGNLWKEVEDVPERRELAWFRRELTEK
jgi:hypothetical protein